MFHIWAKVYIDDHIEKQCVYRREEAFTYSAFFTYLAEICDELDIPTPVLVKAHLFRYAKFNHVVFRASDFMEEIPFTRLVLENIL